MAAANTYVSIATQTLGSTAATIQFTSIPSTYTDLVIVIQPKLTSGYGQMYLDFNGDTATNYSVTALSGNGSSASSARASNAGLANINNTIAVADTTLGDSIVIVNIMNYSNTTTYKTYLSRASNATNGSEADVGLWRSTAAINSTKLYVGGTTFATGTVVSLYGILAA